MRDGQDSPSSVSNRVHLVFASGRSDRKAYAAKLQGAFFTPESSSAGSRRSSTTKGNSLSVLAKSTREASHLGGTCARTSRSIQFETLQASGRSGCRKRLKACSTSIARPAHHSEMCRKSSCAARVDGRTSCAQSAKPHLDPEGGNANAASHGSNA